MKTMAYTILTTIITGLIAGVSGMYIDVQELKAKEPIKEKQLDRIENKIDSIQGFLMQRNSVNIIKRGK